MTDESDALADLTAPFISLTVAIYQLLYRQIDKNRKYCVYDQKEREKIVQIFYHTIYLCNNFIIIIIIFSLDSYYYLLGLII